MPRKGEKQNAAQHKAALENVGMIGEVSNNKNFAAAAKSGD